MFDFFVRGVSSEKRNSESRSWGMIKVRRNWVRSGGVGKYNNCGMRNSDCGMIKVRRNWVRSNGVWRDE